jgi:hypothetical protein
MGDLVKSAWIGNEQSPDEGYSLDVVVSKNKRKVMVDSIYRSRFRAALFATDSRQSHSYSEGYSWDFLCRI